MREDEKQALIKDASEEIEVLEKHIARLKKYGDTFNTDSYESQLARQKIALASLTAEPVAWLTLHSIPPSYQEPDRGGEYLAAHEYPGEKSDDGTDAWPVYRKPEVP